MARGVDYGVCYVNSGMAAERREPADLRIAGNRAAIF